MKVSSIVRERAGLNSLARNKIRVHDGKAPPVLIQTEKEVVVDVGIEWVLGLNFEVACAK